MPNWRDNVLVVRGEREVVEGFLRDVRGMVDGEDTALDFNAIAPYPEEFRRLDEVAKAWEADWLRRGSPDVEWDDRPRDGYNHGGYEWCWAN
jgi:hypothetical protein